MPSTTMKDTLKPSVSPKILGLFSDLVYKDADTRVRIASSLVQHAVSVEEHIQGADSLGREASYCLSRLVRGLASSRAGAREGFFVALVQLLRQLPAASPAALLAAAAAQLPDVRDERQGTEHRLGRLLAAGAAVRAGRLDAELAPLCRQLLADWAHRSYMPPVVASFVVELVQRVPEEGFRDAVWPELRPLLEPGWDECVPERLWLMIACRRRFPDVCDSRFLKQHWGSKKVLSPRNHEGITEMIKVAAKSLPVIHPLVTSLVAFAVERPPAEMVELYRSVLEPLLEDRATALLVLAMLQMVVPHLTTPEMVESVLTPAAVGALVRLLPKRDQRTEQAARGLGSALVSLLLTPDCGADTQLAVLGRLVCPPGSVNFDHMTGTKILTQMINGLKPEALEPFSEIAISAFRGTHADRSLTPRGRAVACDMLCRLVQHPSTPGLTPLKQRLLQMLFTAGAVQDEAVTEELAATALRAFFRALDHPVRRLSDLTALLRALTAHQDKLLRSRTVVLRTPLSAAARQAWDQAAAALRRLEAAAGPDTDVFVILLGHLSQQLFGVDCDTAIDALQELHTCLERQQRKSRGRRRAGDAAEPDWSEVVVDLLLSLLSLNVHLLRSVVRSVFTLLAPTLSREAVMHVFQSLDPQHSMNGENEDSIENDESEDEGTDEEEEDEEESEDGEGGEQEDDESDVEDDVEETEDAQEEMETMRSQVKAALGDESDDAASIDMDDVPEEHFARMDAALAAAFRAMRKDRRMKRGGRQTDEEQALMHFRIRVLDLADVYVRVCPRAPATFDLLPVLVAQLARAAADRLQAPLAGRLRACLARLTAAGGRLPEGHGLTPGLLAELVQEVLRAGARLPATSLELGGLLAAAVRFLVRTSAQLEGDQTPVIDVLRAALDAFFTDRECVYPTRLFSQLLSLPAWPHGWRLAAPLLEAAFSGQVRLYRRTQALQLLAAAAKNAPLVAAAPAEELRRLAADLWRHLEQVLAGVSCASDVKTNYLSSALATLLALRQAAARRGVAVEPPADRLAAELQSFVERVPVGRPLRRLAVQLGARRTGSTGGDSLQKKKKKSRTPSSAAAGDAEPAGKKQRARPPGEPDTKAAAGDADRDGSVDSGVAEVASDVEAPPADARPRKKTKRRADGAPGGAKRLRV